jgi:RNA polymerase sigma-70 factor (ECF subfamily)
VSFTLVASLRTDRSAVSDFDQLYAAQFGNLTVQLYLYFGDLQEAHDVVQEAFCRAYARWGAVSGYEDPVGWVRRVAWNLAVSRWRRARSALRFVRRQARADPPVEGPSPERVAVMAAPAELPERQRRVVVLRYIGDLTVPAILQVRQAYDGHVRVFLDGDAETHRGGGRALNRSRW